MKLSPEKIKKFDNKINYFIEWIGSFSSLLTHTILFAICLVVGLFSGHWDTVLLVLTTLVSLEAIYLAIFIQMSINRNTQSLAEVEKDIDEIQEDIDEIQEDVEDIAEDIDEIQEEDGQEDTEEEKDRKLLKDIQDNILKISSDLELLKKKR